jgi:hypothetical protein
MDPYPKGDILSTISSRALNSRQSREGTRLDDLPARFPLSTSLVKGTGLPYSLFCFDGMDCNGRGSR